VLIHAVPYAAEATPPEILGLALNELSRLVDVVVVVEASQTFTGEPSKPVVADLLATDRRFREHAGRVKAMTIDFPEGMSAWGRDSWSRGAVAQAVSHVPNVSADDLVLFGDADEIPHPRTLRTAMAEVSGPGWVPALKLQGRYHEWFMDLAAVGSPDHLWEFRQPVLTTWRELSRTGGERMRSGSGNLPAAVGPLGWHFTLQGGAEACARKLRSYAHTELGGMRAPRLQAEFIDRERDIQDRCGLVSVLSSELPDTMRDNWEPWLDWLLPRTVAGGSRFLP
jgi:glycosyl transferase family 17